MRGPIKLKKSHKNKFRQRQFTYVFNRLSRSIFGHVIVVVCCRNHVSEILFILSENKFIQNKILTKKLIKI